jgi:hypothetical protein
VEISEESPVLCYNQLASFRSNDGGEPWSPRFFTEPFMFVLAPIANTVCGAKPSRSTGPSID